MMGGVSAVIDEFSGRPPNSSTTRLMSKGAERRRSSACTHVDAALAAVEARCWMRVRRLLVVMHTWYQVIHERTVFTGERFLDALK
jgi:hypothetical protein